MAPDRYCIRAFAWVLAVVTTVGVADTARASPPLSSSGLDLPVLISLWDRTRSISHRLDHQWREWWAEHTHTVRYETARGESRPDSPSSLETLDTIVLDPGHGGQNSGGCGVASVEEKHLTLELAYILRRRLQRRHPDLRVVMTRYWDETIPLHERTHMANQVDADLLLSLHYNAAPHDRAVGIETYFLPTHEVVPGREKIDEGRPVATTSPRVTGMRDERRDPVGIRHDDLAVIQRDLARARKHKYSGRLAQIVQLRLLEHLDTVDRGVKQRNFAVLRGAMMPAVIVEAGFLTHPKEGRRLLTDRHRSKVVEGLIGAVERFDRLRSRAREVTEARPERGRTAARQADSTGQ